ncbi:hypothetical protein, partial [Pseudomonas aeruginosa]|uniref:hypothetical protein n=1 Tax=Pseudomonas aeruginosa TaxID=287 RepID=UPI001E5451F2
MDGAFAPSILLLRGDFFSQCAFFLSAEESHFQTINLCLADSMPSSINSITWIAWLAGTGF